MSETIKKKELLIRVYIVMVFVVLVAALLFGKAFMINVVEGDRWREKGDDLYLDYRPVVADRGNILAEDGSLLATSLPFFEIRWDLVADGLTKEVFEKEIDSLAYCLSRYVKSNWSATRYRDHMIKRRAAGDRYLLIEKNVSYTQLEKIKSFPIFRRGQYKGGLIVERQSKRSKPYKMLASRTLGYVRSDVQPVGLEGSFDNYLRGAEGLRLMQKVRGNVWIPVHDLSEMEPQRGDDLLTTIDIELQDIAQSALLDALKHHNALYGTAILMEVKTGAIKAIANIGTSTGSWEEDYNYAVGSSNEPGSTFKLASIMALLEDGKVTPDSRVDLEGGSTIFYKDKMRDSRMHGIGDTTLRCAFEMSSNVGIAKTVVAQYGQNRNADKFIKRLKQFHLHQPTKLEIIGEGLPEIKEAYNSSQGWSGLSLPWMSTGYEVKLTPLQTLNLYNTVANGGKMMKPYLVQKIIRENKTHKTFAPRIIDRQIASDRTISQTQDLLLGTVLRGTAKNYRTDRYQFAGKTGTAWADYSGKDGSRRKYQASFAGYFPAEKPVYSCMVLIYDPKQNGYYGSAVALPVFRKIADRCFAMKSNLAKPIQSEEKLVASEENMPGLKTSYRTDTEEVLEYTGVKYQKNSHDEWASLVAASSPVLEKRDIENGKIPDVRGMGLKDAIYLLENAGVTVLTKGKGRVKLQSIRPGTEIGNGIKVELTLG